MKTSFSFASIRLLVLALGVVMTDFNVYGQSRNPWLWPFASDSIWNTPIGSSATYVHAGFNKFNDEWMEYDFEYHVRLLDTDPSVTLYNPGPWDNRCNSTTVSWMPTFRVHRYFAPAVARPGWTPNCAAAFLQPDGRAIIQLGPAARCQVPNGAMYGFPQTGEDLQGQGEGGVHWGSGLSGLGGAIRVGELTSSQPIRHVLKINVWGKRYLYKGIPNGTGTKGWGYRWPARNADGYAQDPNSGYGGTNPEVAMGSLCAIPPSMTHASLGLESAVGKKVFDALRDYGAYIVDDTAWSNFHLDGEAGVAEEVQAYYGMSMTGAIDNAIKRDLKKLFHNMHVVSNNAAASKGGPGTRRVATAPSSFSSIGNVTNGEYRIEAKHSGKVLDLSGASTTNGGIVHQWSWTGANNQIWIIENRGNGYYTFKSKHSGRMLDVAGISFDDGAQIHQWDYATGDNQLWSIWPNDDGTYRIIARHSGKAMEVSGSSTADGAKVVQKQYGALANARWKLILSANPAPIVSITSPANGATFNAPASITINANATDSNGTVAKVDFFQGSTLFGTDTSNPYSMTWNNVAAGSYNLTARATDNGGATTTSGGVSVTVKSTVSGASYKVNSGGSAASPFTADANFTGGSTGTTSAAIDTAGVTSPAPQAVYQTERYGNFTYTFGSLTGGASHKVRLHFAEIYFGAAGQRKFDVKINGTQVLDDFDIFATTGAKNKATVREFNSTADASGIIRIEFLSVVNNSKISGIEIIKN